MPEIDCKLSEGAQFAFVDVGPVELAQDYIPLRGIYFDLAKRPQAAGHKQPAAHRRDAGTTLQGPPDPVLPYSTVTDFARLRGLSTSVPRAHAV